MEVGGAEGVLPPPLCPPMCAQEFAEALSVYAQVFESDPKGQVSVLNNKAAVYIEMGELDAAEVSRYLGIDAAEVRR